MEIRKIRRKAKIHINYGNLDICSRGKKKHFSKKTQKKSKPQMSIQIPKLHHQHRKIDREKKNK